MTDTNAALLAVVLVFAATLYIIWQKMKVGFGPFNTSVILLYLVLFITAIAFVLDRVEWPSASGLLLAIAGFAGGLFSTSTKPVEASGQTNQNTSPQTQSLGSNPDSGR